MPETSEIGLAQLGIASILKQNRLAVPPNQREYAWTTKEVRTLLQDFSKAIANRELGAYFLGTIVTIPKTDGLLEVVDGQQRLATVAIVLAEIRNYLKNMEPIIAESIENECITVIDRGGRARIPRLKLNLDDNEFFRAMLSGENSPPQPTRHSHILIKDAFDESRKHIHNIVSGFDVRDHGDVLNRWITFMESRAFAVLLRVPNDADAYRMFETLNDRGLKTSQSDLVKNYLFGRSAERLPEVQQKWTFMRGSLETIEEDDITITFLRHALTVIYGFTRESLVYETVQEHAKAPQPVVTFMNRIESLAGSYVAIFNADHEKWNSASDSTRRALEVLNLFNIQPMRPLMLATAQAMGGKDLEGAFQYYVSLCVRLMLASSTRTGSVEEGLSGADHEIYKGQITNIKELKTYLAEIMPTDEKFKNAFETAAVSNGKLARYYLRSLEMAAKREREPWHIPNDDRSVINLEHVLPEKPEGNWPQFSAEEVKIYYRRIGNLVLLRASDNSTLKSAGFTEKKSIFKNSPYELTKQIASCDNWRIEEIIARQKTLAELAVRAWPI
jgi:Protein of unknown function DUF262/Protein of unknown function (DUF1524)